MSNKIYAVVFCILMMVAFVFLLIVVIFSQPCSAKVHQILWNRESIEHLALDTTKKKNPAYQRTVSYAKRFCEQPAVSVVGKLFLPEGCTKNDYVSLSTYAWPDTTKPGGMPYIIKDGYNNPETDKFNSSALKSLVERMQMLTLAWKLTGESKYADKATEQVRVWFIDRETRMNPNLNFGQIVPGVNGNKGNSYGVLDGYNLVYILDPLLLLEDYAGFTTNDQNVVRQWFKDYLIWLTTSKLGLQEALSNNNHGTSYDGQILAFSIYTGNEKLAKGIIKTFPILRVNLQIESDGSQPRELGRTRSFVYSVMNLDRMMDFLLMAQFYGYPIKPRKLERYYKAWEFLIPYVGEGQKDWPYEQVIETGYAQWQLIRDTYIISKYLRANRRERFMHLSLPNDERTQRSIYSIVY